MGKCCQREDEARKGMNDKGVKGQNAEGKVIEEEGKSRDDKGEEMRMKEEGGRGSKNGGKGIENEGKLKGRLKRRK